MGFRDMVHRFGSNNSQAQQTQPDEHQEEEYDAGEEEGELQQKYGDGNETYEDNNNLEGAEVEGEGYQEEEEGVNEEGGAEEEVEGEVQEGDEEVADEDDGQAAGEIVSVEDQTAGLNDEETRQELAAIYSPNAEDVPSDDEQAIKNHTFDITIRSVDGQGNYYELKGKVDSGADANCISEDAVDLYELPIIPEEPGFEQTFKTGDGKRVASLGQVLLKFSAGHEEKVHNEHFHVVPGMSEQVLLGHPFIERTGAVKLKGKFKDTPDEQAERADEVEPDIDLMALQPATKAEAASDSTFVSSVKKIQGGKRKGREAPS